MAQLIQVQDRYVRTITVGVESDNLVERVTFAGLPMIGEAQLVTLHWVLADDATVGDIVALTATEGGYAWDVDHTITQYGGRRIEAYVRVAAGDQVWNSKSFVVKVAALPDADGVASFTPSVIDQMLAAIVQHNADMAEALSGTREARGAAETARDEADADAEATAQDRAAVAQDKTAVAAAASAAQDSADDAAASATEAANNMLNGVATHNASSAAHEDIRDDMLRVEALARGRARSITFDTKAQLDAWVTGTYARADGLAVADLEIGDNLYIRDVGVPDYWWDGAAPSELEAEAPDLVEYYTKAQVDGMLPIYLSESDYAALVAAGTTEAGRVYYPVPDEYWEG